MYLDDSADGSNFYGTLSSNWLTGLGMASSGIVYSIRTFTLSLGTGGGGAVSM